MNWSSRIEAVKSQGAFEISLSLVKGTWWPCVPDGTAPNGGEPPSPHQGMTNKLLCYVTEISRLIYYHSIVSLCKEDVRFDLLRFLYNYYEF